MAEEVKPVRLSKAAKEVNVSVSTIVEFLGKKGHTVDSNPNTKLTGEQYTMVLKEFQSDKVISEKAQELTLETVPKKEKPAAMPKEPLKETVKVVAVPEDVSVEDPDFQERKPESPLQKAAPVQGAEEEKPLHVEVSLEKEAEGAETVENSVKADKPQVEDPGLPVVKTAGESKPVEKEEKTGETASVAPGIEPVPESKKDKPEPKEVAVPESEPLSEKKDEPGSRTEKDGNPDETKTVDSVKANENALEKPKADAGLKTESEEETKRHEPAKESKEKPAENIFGKGLSHIAGPKIVSTMDAKTLKLAQQGKAVKPDKIERPQIVEPEPQPEPAAKPEPPKEDNFVKTEYVKLAGPVLTGQKVDLSQFERKPKPVASSKDVPGSFNKKRRKRIKDEQAPHVGGRAGLDNLFKNNNDKPKGQQPGGQQGQGPNANKPKNKKNDRRVPPAPQMPVDDQEIEKQIKETLARLSPLGKSKTSKHRREKRQMISQHMEAEMAQEMQDRKVLKVTEFVTVNELATMMNVPVNQIIATCMSLGLFVSINQRLSAEPISLLAEEYGFKVEFVDADVIHELESQDEEEELGEAVPRTPIVTVMGHVDHGKTSLLDYIRKTNVIAGEAGGITQHIGAYEVELEDGRKITFLDTPGHEAFTAMRARGAKITDIAIIVVAADDKVMPQTVEAINHAQAAGVPIVFAINKIDKPGADPERIKSELAEMNLLVEDWGGKYQSQDISAKKGIGVEALLEKVLLEAELLDLKAHPERRGKGTVIESSLDKGRGYVAKILVQDGTIRVGDFILAGYTYGRVKAMYNERNQSMKSAGPSQPVLLLGLNGAPQPGDVFNVMADEKEAKEIANRRQQLQREQGLRAQKHITLDEIGRRIAIGDFKELNIIVKADVDGSVEALSDSLLKLSTPEVQVNVIHKSVGQITESDVLLASASEAIIIGFQVRPSMAARKLAESEQIDIRLYSIIYDAINEIKDAIEGMLSPVIQEKIVANLEVREVFKISKVGTIAGCIVLDGRLGRNTKIRIIRDGIVVYTGELGSLRRFKDDVKEVVVGQDCGLNVKNFNDVKVGDIIEGYDQVEIKRTL